MASTQQLLATQEDIQLTPNQVLSEQHSLIAIKKLLAIAVSGITYLRGIFPEKAYANRNVGDQRVMILREEHSCPGVVQMLQWVQGCFEAIQKKYLRTVIISIFTDPENPQKVTELYQFRIQYTPNGAQMHFESNNNNNKLSSMVCGNTKKASILLVRKLYTLMQNLGPLPEDVCMSMKLAYYDDVTPLDYQPAGFKEADGDTVEFEQEPVKLTMGEVVTPFHCLRLDMATERHRLDPTEETIHVKEKWVLKMEEGMLTESHVSEDVEKPDKSANLDEADIQLTCEEKMENCEKATEMDTLVKNNSDMEVGLRRTRSGRIFKSIMVSRYDISSSQETPSSTVAKKRKFSEPKEHH
ncbi:HORMA domain-containing protein 1 isoform X2 [Parambassis ranga]|uniref:HORMA domain-containing protein 1 isoform X2 n=1 Tax=Parambassis ranga TaxID=210632 RepID=A0A6P7JZ00_9TELE|nr:HORMA domain-containing protein 1 isoform X2 [Parambassis ranga]